MHAIAASRYAHANHPVLNCFESAPEVRAPCSASVTPPRGSYDPVRLPPGPPSELRPPTGTGSPMTPNTLTSMPCPIPRRIETGASVGCFPIPRDLPRYSAGSASTASLSRLAQASLALRPTGSLNRPSGLDREAPIHPVARTNRLPATRSTDNSCGSYLHWCYAPSGALRSRARSINRTNRGKFLLRVPATCPRPVGGSKFGWA
jgi:hypothetical protein